MGRDRASSRWHPDTTWLKSLRDRIAAGSPDFERIVGARAFRESFGSISDDGESLKRGPPGYPADHPAADLLRKNVTFCPTPRR